MKQRARPAPMPMAILGFGILSFLPLITPFLIYVLKIPYSYGPWSIFISMISVLTFGFHASKNKALPSKINLFFATTIALSLSYTAPLYWFFGIFIPAVEGDSGFTMKTKRVWTLFLSFAPMVTLVLSRIWVYIFASHTWMAWVPGVVSIFTLFYFSHHLMKYPGGQRDEKNKDIYWLLSFFLTLTFSLPFYWFKRIYKPTLFPANIVLGSGDDFIESENTTEVEFNVALNADLDAKSREEEKLFEYEFRD